MEGLTILSQSEIYDTVNINILAILFLVGGVLLVYGIILALRTDSIYKKILYVKIIIIGFLLVLSSLYLDIYKVPTGRYEYKVLISENLPLIEFYQKYQIISNDGIIFVIQDLEDMIEN